MSCGETIDSKSLVERDGIKYKVNEQTPYSGKVISYYENGKIREEGNYKDGKKDGKWIKDRWFNQEINKDLKLIQYYDNGSIKMEGYELNGEKRLMWKYYTIDSYIDYLVFQEYPRMKKISSNTNNHKGNIEGFRIYEEDDNIVVCNYQDGILEGQWTSYDNYGFISSSGKYVKGLKEGPWFNYSFHGDVKSLLIEGKDLHVHIIEGVEYENGEKIGKLNQRFIQEEESKLRSFHNPI